MFPERRDSTQNECRGTDFPSSMSHFFYIWESKHKSYDPTCIKNKIIHRFCARWQWTKLNWCKKVVEVNLRHSSGRLMALLFSCRSDAAFAPGKLSPGSFGFITLTCVMPSTGGMENWGTLTERPIGAMLSLIKLPWRWSLKWQNTIESQ